MNNEKFKQLINMNELTLKKMNELIEKQDKALTFEEYDELHKKIVELYDDYKKFREDLRQTEKKDDVGYMEFLAKNKTH